MEFYELLEEIIEAVPPQYADVAAALSAALPWVLGVCAGATCFFGHKVHRAWNAFFFFWIGFLVPVFVIGLLAEPAAGPAMDALVAFGAVCGVVCAVFSARLFKLQLFVTTFFLAFAAVPAYLHFLGDGASILLGFLAAVAAGILSMKYKYIMTILTTSFTGAALLLGVLAPVLHLSQTAAALLSLVLGAAGLGVQCYVERKELRESKEELQTHYKKVKKKLTKKAPAPPQPEEDEAEG